MNFGIEQAASKVNTGGPGSSARERAPEEMKPMPGETEVPELYAKVIRPMNESRNRYLIHFTSIPPRLCARLVSLIDER